MAGMDRETGHILDGWGHVSQSVFVLFTTPFFTRVMRAYVGSNVIRLLGENINGQTVSRVREAIAVALWLFEPRLVPTRIDLTDFDRTGLSKWVIEGTYRPGARFDAITGELTGDLRSAGTRSLTFDPSVIRQALVATGG
jgi:phage baseplate assembly protein W